MAVKRRSISQAAQAKELMLQNRELVWSQLPPFTRKAALPFLTVGDCRNLDNAVTNRQDRSHLVKAYKDLESPAFNGYLYTDEEDFRVLRWVMERGINLRGFSMQVKGERKSGPVMRLLMGTSDEVSHRDIAEYYAARGKLVGVDVVYKGYTALMWASYMGYLDIAKALLAAGADKDKADTNGCTALMRAGGRGHAEIVKELLAAGADKDKADTNGYTASMCAGGMGNTEIVKELLAAGAEKDERDTYGRTPCNFAAHGGHLGVVET